MSKANWEDLNKNAKERELKNLTLKELIDKYDKTEGFFIEKKRIYESIPRIKKGKLGIKDKIPNPPDKKILLNRSRLIPPEIAILEFIDNIFDNYMKNLKIGLIDHNLQIELIFYFDEINKLAIKENSGGIKRSDLQTLLIMGKTSKGEAIKVGTWGEAFLNSVIGLGKSAELFTDNPGSWPLNLKIGEDFFQSDEIWELTADVFEKGDLDGCDIGSTTLIIENIKEKYHTNSEEIYKELISLIEETYWKKVIELERKGYSVDLRIIPYSSDVIIAQFIELDYKSIFSHFPYCPPIKIENYEIEVKNQNGERGRILVDAYAGLNLSTNDENKSKKYKGVWMWGNDRLFVKSKSDQNVGFGTSKTKIPSTVDKRTARNLTFFLFFKTEDDKWNEFIPWKIPTKNGYNPECKIADKILNLIKTLAERFLYTVNTLRGPEFQLRIFTKEFTELDNEDKINELKKACQQDKKKEFCPSNFNQLNDEEIKEYCLPIIELNSDDFLGLEIFDETSELEKINKEYKKSIKQYNSAIFSGKNHDGMLYILIDTFVELEFLPSSHVKIIETGLKNDTNDISTEDDILIKKNDAVLTKPERKEKRKQVKEKLGNATDISKKKITEYKKREPTIRITISIKKESIDKIKMKFDELGIEYIDNSESIIKKAIDVFIR